MRVAVLGVVLLLSTRAGADSPEPEARQLFSAGSVAFEAGKFQEAARAFHAAYALLPRSAFLYNEASALRRAFEVTGDRSSATQAIALYERFLAAPDTSMTDTQEAAAQLAALGRAVAARPDQVVVVTRTAPAPRRTGLIVGLTVGAVVLAGAGLGLGLGLGLRSSAAPSVTPRW